MSHLKILVKKVFTVSLCFLFANIPTSLLEISLQRPLQMLSIK